VRVCSCGAPISVAARRDALHCSARCRKRVSRLQAAEPLARR
jgi:hypothetical protein